MKQSERHLTDLANAQRDLFVLSKALRAQCQETRTQLAKSRHELREMVLKARGMHVLSKSSGHRAVASDNKEP
ncbi:hypothetical protein X769_00040 [Mesorhizobium sp. LSJC268A00]|nr:hypothetical protein X769_00040 [Mesorhizobium sp. LSJC268A00]ESX18022.1 hypothetical protein X767_25170 [Mesorhizobium sp. LSJC264A00]